MSRSTRARSSSAAVCLALLAVACSGGSDTDLAPPEVDVSGAWLGDWTEVGPLPLPSPATGAVSLQLVQEANGVVTGTVVLSNVGCASDATFQGGLFDLFILGMASEAPDVELRFEIDARNAEQGAHGTLIGTFLVVSGAGCRAPFEAEFLVSGEPPAPR